MNKRNHTNTQFNLLWQQDFWDLCSICDLTLLNLKQHIDSVQDICDYSAFRKKQENTESVHEEKKPYV